MWRSKSEADVSKGLLGQLVKCRAGGTPPRSYEAISLYAAAPDLPEICPLT